MKILGIETSCDETAVAIIEIDEKDNISVLSNVVSSQVKLHAKFGGVVPNLAAREHAKNIGKVFKLALKQARIKSINEIDLVAVTRGPGLGPALLVGLTFAKTLAWKNNLPIIGVNHLSGHVYSNWLTLSNEQANLKFGISNDNPFPIMNLIVSGGHTELALMSARDKSSSGDERHSQKIIGETLDDAIGEAFDKVARLLGLGYPGGPAISKYAENGDPIKYPLPRPMMGSKDYNFSYSGLKTAVLYLIRDIKNTGAEIDEKIKADISASFQEAATDVVVRKTIKAAREYRVKSVMLSGGVSANRNLREKLKFACDENGYTFYCPEMKYTTDNAAMIAIASYFASKDKKTSHNWQDISMDANLSL
jgi:N6-L-threonylcarbamoyladenine synthase